MNALEALKLKKNPFDSWKLLDVQETADGNTKMYTLVKKHCWPVIAIFIKEPARIIVTGEYGNWAWDKLTSVFDIKALPFNDLHYFSEKLSYESQEVYKVFNEEQALRDLKNIVKYAMTFYDMFNGTYFDKKAGEYKKVQFSETLWSYLVEDSFIRYDRWIEIRNDVDKIYDIDKYFHAIKRLINEIKSGDEYTVKDFITLNYNILDPMYVQNVKYYNIGQTYSYNYLHTILALENIAKRTV